MYAHFSNSILLDFYYLQRQFWFTGKPEKNKKYRKLNGLIKSQPFKLGHHGDTALDS